MSLKRESRRLPSCLSEIGKSSRATEIPFLGGANGMSFRLALNRFEMAVEVVGGHQLPQRDRRQREEEACFPAHHRGVLLR